MPDFKPISPEDKRLFDRCLREEHTQSSSVSFGNVFLWDLLCRRNVADLNGRLGVEFLCRSGTPFYAFPVGAGPLEEAVAALHGHARAQGRPFELHGVTVPEREALEAACPDCFDYEPDPDNYDYIYSAEALATLAGKKLHGKRNHCNRFEALHPDWRFEPLTPALFGGCREILRAWDAEKDGGDAEENEAIERAFQYWDSLGMEGGVLFAGGRVAAFTFGERLSADTFDAHFEKALDTVEGAYPMVCREFVRQLRAAHPELLYINREEDMGLPGLRRAKEEWYPLYQVEKYCAAWKGEG